MKIREGLVSNSSSTSFVVFHNKIGAYDLFYMYPSVKDFPENKYYFYGHEDTGIDFFPITKEIFKLIGENLNQFDTATFYDVFLIESVESDKGFSKKSFVDMTTKFPEQFRMAIIDIDHYLTTKIKDFKQKYLNKV